MNDAIILGIFGGLPCVALGALILFARSQFKRRKTTTEPTPNLSEAGNGKGTAEPTPSPSEEGNGKGGTRLTAALSRVGTEKPTPNLSQEGNDKKGTEPTPSPSQEGNGAGNGAGSVGWGRLILGNALVLFFLCSLLLLAGECYFRFIYDATDSFGCTRSCERWLDRHYHVTKQGYRDDVGYALAIAPNKRRVSFMGDSFTTGHGVAKVEDVFWYRLRKAQPGWEVHDLAALGKDSGEEGQMMADTFAIGYQPDEVVLVYCLNDISDLIPEWITSVNKLYAEMEKTGWLVRNSYFINTLYWRNRFRNDSNLGNYYQCVRDAYNNGHWEVQKQRLKAFRDLIQSRGGHLSVVTFPFLHALGPDYPYAATHAKLDAFWRELGVPHLDLLPVYRELPPKKLVVNRYDAHPNEYAHELAAKAMEPFLVQVLNSRPRSGGQPTRVEGR